MTESVVRLAQPEDRESVLDLIRLLNKENGLFPLSERKVAAHVDRYFDGTATAIIGVIGPVGTVEGGIFLNVEEPYYSEVSQLTELFNVVHPDHRTKGHAKALIAFAKKCSDEVKMTLMIGIISNIRTASKIRLYERQLKPAGAFFVHNPQYAGGTW